tara:strand:+ start:3199 stop:5343 length:2145 start_codon:yes stop_codon:yes gene_type:complete
MAWKKVLSTSNGTQTLRPVDMQPRYFNDPNDSATDGIYGGFCTGGDSIGDETRAECLALGGPAKWVQGKVLKTYLDGAVYQTRWEKDYKFDTQLWNGSNIVDFDPHNQSQDTPQNDILNGNTNIGATGSAHTISHTGTNAQVLRSFNLNLDIDPFGHPILWNVSETHENLLMSDLGYEGVPDADKFVHDAGTSLAGTTQGFTAAELADNEAIDSISWTVNTNAGGAGASTGGSIEAGSVEATITKRTYLLEDFGYNSGTCSGSTNDNAYSSNYNNGTAGDPAGCKAAGGDWTILGNADRYDYWVLKHSNKIDGVEGDETTYRIGHREEGEQGGGDSTAAWASGVDFKNGTSPSNGSVTISPPAQPGLAGQHTMVINADLGTADRVNQIRYANGTSIVGSFDPAEGEGDYMGSFGYVGLTLDPSTGDYVDNGSIYGTINLSPQDNYTIAHEAGGGVSANSSGFMNPSIGSHRHVIRAEFDHTVNANQGQLLRTSKFSFDGGSVIDGVLKLEDLELTGNLIAAGAIGTELTGETQIQDSAVAINNVVDVNGEISDWDESNSAWILGHATAASGLILENELDSQGTGESRIEFRQADGSRALKNVHMGDVHIMNPGAAIGTGTGNATGILYANGTGGGIADANIIACSSTAEDSVTAENAIVGNGMRLGMYTTTSASNLAGLPAEPAQGDSRLLVAELGSGGDKELFFGIYQSNNIE